MRGTVGNPKNDISKVALLKIAAKGITGAFSGGTLTGGKTNSILQGLTEILSGSRPAATNVGTNQPATNQPPLNNLLNDLLKPESSSYKADHGTLRFSAQHWIQYLPFRFGG